MNFLRTGDLVCPNSIPYSCILKEAQFYCIVIPKEQKLQKVVRHLFVMANSYRNEIYGVISKPLATKLDTLAKNSGKERYKYLGSWSVKNESGIDRDFILKVINILATDGWKLAFQEINEHRSMYNYTMTKEFEVEEDEK